MITGAGSGIGRAIAQRLDQDGAQLTLFGRRLNALEETADLLNGAAFCASLDITDCEAVKTSFVQAAQTNGPIRSLVANAGVGGANSPDDEDGDRFDELINVNLRGSYYCLRAAQENLAEPATGSRQLIVISSILARIGVPGYSGYCASKAALLGLVRSLAIELAPNGVTVNAICPGWVDTDMAWDGLAGMASAMNVDRETAHQIAMKDVPIGRMGKPEEIAGLVAYLLSAAAEGTTGSAFDINGGAFMA